MLEVASLDAGYGDAQALFEVGLAVPRGETVALLGRNGAGKSTLLAAVMGLVRPWSGTIRLEGQDIAGQPPHRIARAGIGLVPEDRRIFTNLTVAENLAVAQRPPRPDAPRWDVAAVTALFDSLGGLMQRRGDAISGGEQQMLAIARTLLAQPRVLLLDEPAEGLAPRVAAGLRERLAELKGHGLTMVVAAQNLAFARALADRAVILEQGAVRFAGRFDAIDADDQARQALLAL